ncbi:MarR family transcriptional regulator [soil metagenome]
MKQRYLASIRLLAQCYQAFEQISAAHVRSFNLTPSQFDIIATLGNTDGMTFGELGQKTLITKGTMTGVVDRLEAKGLVKRITGPEDRRSTIVKLTKAGEREFERTFGAHIEFCKDKFTGYSEEDFAALDRELAKLKSSLTESLARLKT